MEAAQAQEGPEGGKLVRRGNAHFKGQEGEDGVMERGGRRRGRGRGEGEKRAFVSHLHVGTWGHFAHLLWSVLLIPQAMST